MDPLKERNFHKRIDSYIKLSLILERARLLSKMIQLFFNLIISATHLVSRTRQNNTKRLVIICLHRLGDTVFCIPAIKGIYDCYNKYEIFILCYPESKDILEIYFESENIVTIEKKDFLLHRRIAKKICRKVVNDLKPEIIFDLTGNPASASLILSSRAKEVIGTNLQYFQKLYTSFVTVRTKPHYMDIYLDVLRYIRPDYDKYSYQFESNYNQKNKIVIHPFAIRKAKEWNLKKYIRLAERLNNNYDVCLIAPPKFIEEDVLHELTQLEIEVKVTNSIFELISLVKEASLFISNDSGPTYIASMMGKPTFIIYGPTNPKFSLPFGINHKYYKKELFCSAKEEKICFTLGGINCPSYECMNLISVDEIEESINNFIKVLGIEEKSDHT